MSDDKRDETIARLSDAFAKGDLEVEELDRRLDLAHQATTGTELDVLLADLKQPSTALVVSPTRAIVDPSRAAHKKLSCVLSSVEKRGLWVVPKTLDARVLFGNAELDFRQASLGPGVTEIDVRVTLSSLEIILPPNLAIEVDVSSFAGSVEERHRVGPDPDPDRPILRITGSVKFGSLEITTKLP